MYLFFLLLFPSPHLPYLTPPPPPLSSVTILLLLCSAYSLLQLFWPLSLLSNSSASLAHSARSLSSNTTSARSKSILLLLPLLLLLLLLLHILHQIFSPPKNTFQRSQKQLIHLQSFLLLILQPQNKQTEEVTGIIRPHYNPYSHKSFRSHLLLFFAFLFLCLSLNFMLLLAFLFLI